MDFPADAEIIIKALEEYRLESKAAEKPVIAQKPLKDIIEDLNLDSFVRNGGLSKDNLDLFIKKYLARTTRLHHPSYMAHQVSVPHYSGALGSFVDGFSNNPMAIYEMGPAAAAIEYFLVNWLLKKVGWKPSPTELHDSRNTDEFGGGLLTHGGSLANLTALIAARNRVAPEAWKRGNPHDLALMAPQGSHYSIARAAGILGMGQDSIYGLEVDRKGAIKPEKVPSVFTRIKKEGKRPIALVANACSTAVGIYDPLQEIGDFCKDNDIWLHIDGAHGASVLLSERYRHLMKGVGLADSLTWDAHKLMRVPTLCAALLFQRHSDIDTAFEQEASYLFHEKKQPGFDFIHRTVECTKAGLGLKFFLVLGALGEKALAQYIETQIDLALTAYRYINELSDFNCPVEPQCNILCFRIDGTDLLQLRIRDRLNLEGEFYISTTIFREKRYLRLSIMNPHTTMKEIELLIKRVRQIKTEIEPNSN